VLRNIAVVWQRMEGGVRILKVTGAPRVSYWELRTTNGNFLALSPANTLGILTFETTFANQARLFPVTLRGSAYREGILINSIPII
jgi:predicted small integral membrane protein